MIPLGSCSANTPVKTTVANTDTRIADALDRTKKLRLEDPPKRIDFTKK